MSKAETRFHENLGTAGWNAAVNSAWRRFTAFQSVVLPSPGQTSRSIQSGTFHAGVPWENITGGIFMKYPENRKIKDDVTLETAMGPAGSIVEILFYASLFLIGLCTMFLFFQFAEIDSSTLNMPFIGHLFAILNIGFLMIMILCMAELVRNRIRDRKDTR